MWAPAIFPFVPPKQRLSSGGSRSAIVNQFSHCLLLPVVPKLHFVLSLTFALLVGSAIAQQSLQQQIRSIAAEAHGKVSVACSLPATPLTCDLDPTAHPPMQSVFKLPLALTILHQLEQGKFSLAQPIRFRPDDLILPKPYSPLQDKYPKANVDVPLRTLLQYTVALSDNTAADILLRLAGGPEAVDQYVASLDRVSSRRQRAGAAS